ncbi:MAG: hypothetical protein HC799_04350 [Limnothrix sp. RL_2_0]|nr:hypothetical protein [Limnothrix sp. RL_2_0]
MPRGKITAIVTGAISLLVAIAYLVLVQVLDFRGEMKPAPISEAHHELTVASATQIDLVIVQNG